jgi:competence protein ComGC
MKLDEKGSTLAVALLVILVFSVLGLALMGNVVSENKQVNATESNVQARYLAENGLTYFEADFNKYVTDTNFDLININRFLQNYKNLTSVGEASRPDETQIMAETVDSRTIKVTSFGKSGSAVKKLVGYYKLSFDFDRLIPPLGEITGKAIDFSKTSLANVDLLGLLNLNLVNTVGNDEKYYQVPSDSTIDVSLLGKIFDVNAAPDSQRFKTMEQNQVIATREGWILGMNLLNNAVNVQVLDHQDVNDTNVMINGRYSAVSLLGKSMITGFQDIDFDKLAVMGNAMILQDRNGLFGDKDTAPLRRFTFGEGLYVNKSLTIGGSPKNTGNSYRDDSKLMLRGNMAVMDNLSITNTDVTIGDSSDNEPNLKREDYISNLYVKGDALINNACVHEKNYIYDFRLFAKGSITIKNTPDCNEYDGVFYSESENGINIITGNKPMTIVGGLFGKVTVDYPDKLTIIPNPNYPPKVTLTKLTPQGRSY